MVAQKTHKHDGNTSQLAVDFGKSSIAGTVTAAFDYLPAQHPSMHHSLQVVYG